MKRIALLSCALMLLASVVCNSRTGGHGGPSLQLNPGPLVQTTPSQWQRYTVKNEQFSVALPERPTVDKTFVFTEFKDERLETSLARFYDGVLYVIVVFENRSPKQSLDSFIKDRARSGHPYNTKSAKKLTLDGVSGKAFSLQGIDGAVQFFSKGDRLFQFAAYNAVPDDVRVTKFFSSISLANNNDSIEVSETALPPVTSATNPPGKVFTPQQVDQKFKPILMAHAQYTELARQNQAKGTVILQCILGADGTITSIQVVTGLPFGLTENAIAAASKLKFIPAMKDGKYVSVSTRHIFNFDLF